MFTVGVEHDGLATFAAVNDKVSVKKSNANRAAVYFSALCYDKPALGKVLGPKPYSAAFATLILLSFQAKPEFLAGVTRIAFSLK